MGSDGVVVDLSGFGDTACLGECDDGMFVEALVAQPTVEALAESVLDRLDRGVVGSRVAV